MKKILALVLTLSLVLSLGCLALAEEEIKAPAGYPSQAVNLIVGFGAGGDTDTNNRLLAKYVEQLLGASIAVSNNPGSNGAANMAQYQSQPTDGYTIIGANTGAVLSNYSNGKSQYSYQDMEVIALFGKGPGDMLFASKASGITSMDDLIARCEEDPFSINLGTSMGGTTQAYAMMLEASGIDVNIVDGGDGASRAANLLGGHVDVCFVPYLNVREYIESGDFICLGTISSGCSELPDVPTLESTGRVASCMDGCYIWLAPKGTDPEIVAYLASLAEQVVNGNEAYQAEQAAINYNDAFVLTGEAALEWLAENQLIADANAEVLK